MSEELKGNSVDLRVQIALLSRKFQFLKAEFLNSVLIQESGKSAFFHPWEEQFEVNLASAARITGKSREEILKLVTLTDGRILKFRLEPSYYNNPKYSKCPYPARFYISSSWGLGQKIGLFLIQGVPPSSYISTILAFAQDQQAQVNTCAKDLENLLLKASKEPKIAIKSIKNLSYHAYKGYNSGNILSIRADVILRAQTVIKRVKWS